VLADYIIGRATKAGLKEMITFATAVRHVTYDDASGKFTVTVEDLATHTTTSSTFDYVICAGGHFSTPHVPTFPGLDKFPGRVLHAHDFRDAEEFRNKNVLIVGASYSAEDIGLQVRTRLKHYVAGWNTGQQSIVTRL
jgi:trimethylamine monooxygenase